MPSKTRKMHNTMAKAAKDPEFAKRMDIPQNVAKEMLKKDKASGKFRGKTKKH